MKDLRAALIEYSQRCEPAGSKTLRDRVVMELLEDGRRTERAVAPGWMQPGGSTSPASPRVVRGWAVALVVAAVVVAIVAVPALLLGGGDTPPIDSTTTVPPDSTTTTVVAPAPVPGPEVWGPVGTATVSEAAGLFDITELPDGGLAAVGWDPNPDDGLNGAVFLSRDYETWEQVGVGDPALTEGMVFTYSVTAAGPGIVIGGRSCVGDYPEEGCAPYPTVWTTADGSSWTRTDLDPDVFGVITALLDSPHGILAGGATASLTDDGFRPTVWMSQDATEWDIVWQGDSHSTDTAFAAGIQDFVEGPDGTIVAVGNGGNADGQIVAAVWTSTDGHTWDRVDADDPVFGSEQGRAVTMHGVTHGNGTYVAVGTAGGLDAAIWHSQDAIQWSRASTPVKTFGGTGSLGDVAAMPTGFLAVGDGFSSQRDGGVRAWTSPDGAEWSRVLHLGDGNARSVVVTQSFAAMAGIAPAGTDLAASVWAGPIIDATNPPSDPVPEGEVHEPIAPPSNIQTLEEGASCDELVGADYSYPEVVAYWNRWDQPDELSTGNETVPCVEHFDANEIDAVFYPDDFLAVQIVSALGETNTFTAAGPAVEAGLLCPSGTTEFADEPVGLPGSLWRWEDEYTCNDGTGSFILGADVFINLERDDWVQHGTWSIVSGTGRYEGLMGGGASITHPLDADSWSDVLKGRVATPTASQ